MIWVDGSDCACCDAKNKVIWELIEMCDAMYDMNSTITITLRDKDSGEMTERTLKEYRGIVHGWLGGKCGRL